MEKAQAAGAIRMPEVKAGRYLVDSWLELGMVHSDGTKVIPWAEIHAYSSLTGEIERKWEALVIRSMSAGYLEGYGIGMNPLGKSPW